MHKLRTLCRLARPYVAALAMADGLSGCSGGTDSGEHMQLAVSDPTAFQTVKVVSVGGVPTSPPSAPCRLEDAQMVAATASPPMLSWDFCDFYIFGNPATPVARHQGNRELSPDEVTSVAAALGRIAASDAKTCGADAPVLTLDVETPTAHGKYADDFYAGCPSELNSGRTFVSGVGELQAVLIGLFTKTE